MPKPRRVDFLQHKADLMAATLGSLGFSTAMIAARTKLSHGQVLYRLKKAAVKRADFRDGESDMAKYVVSAASSKASEAIRSWAAGAAKKESPMPARKAVPA